MKSTTITMLGAGVLAAGLVFAGSARANSDDQALAFITGAAVGYVIGGRDVDVRHVHYRHDGRHHYKHGYRYDRKHHYRPHDKYRYKHARGYKPKHAPHFRHHPKYHGKAKGKPFKHDKRYGHHRDGRRWRS